MTNEQQLQWLEDLIGGPAGFMDYMERECGEDITYEMGCVERREQTVQILRRACSFVIRCLANPQCEGSAEILGQIMERREHKKNSSE